MIFPGVVVSSSSALRDRCYLLESSLIILFNCRRQTEVVKGPLECVWFYQGSCHSVYITCL
jgi:hypothetical protein